MFKNKIVLITAGPTQEPLDPVRFISNHSTGKMGFALAEAFANQGAQVLLVSGPTQEKTFAANIQIFRVTTADEMYAQVKQLADRTDILVFAAAVADYKPKEVSPVKVKKQAEIITLELVKNIDIAKAMGQVKKPGQFSVGFALETNNEIANAQAKLQTKNLDMIVLNSLQDVGAGFSYDTNKITIIQKDKVTPFALKSKTAVARDIVLFISQNLHA